MRPKALAITPLPTQIADLAAQPSTSTRRERSSDGEYPLKMTLYRTAKANNLANALFAALASETFSADAVTTLAARLAEQNQEGVVLARTNWSMEAHAPPSPERQEKQKALATTALRHLSTVLSQKSAAAGTHGALTTEMKQVLSLLLNGIQVFFPALSAAERDTAQSRLEAVDAEIKRLKIQQREAGRSVQTYRSGSSLLPDKQFETANKRLLTLTADIERCENEKDDLEWAAAMTGTVTTATTSIPDTSTPSSCT